MFDKLRRYLLRSARAMDPAAADPRALEIDRDTEVRRVSRFRRRAKATDVRHR